MPNYNTNSAFSVNTSGRMPNVVDDLIFFQDINRDEKEIWDRFEELMATGDYAAAQTFVKGYANVHGYFGDLYNMMVNRIYAMQNLLAINKNLIDAGTAPFNEFVKPEIFRYQDTEENIKKDQVWIGPKGYFDEEITLSINKLKITVADGFTKNGLTYSVGSDGIITINGTTTNNAAQGGIVEIGSVPSDVVITSGDIWIFYNYYTSGTVARTSGTFNIAYTTASGVVNRIAMNVGRASNMHTALNNIGNNARIYLEHVYGYNETYTNYKVAFMVVNSKDISPNQPYVPYKAG